MGPKRGRQSNHYWAVDAIGKEYVILILYFPLHF